MRSPHREMLNVLPSPIEELWKETMEHGQPDWPCTITASNQTHMVVNF